MVETVKKERIVEYNEEYINLNVIKISDCLNLKLNTEYLLYDGVHLFAGRHILFDFIGSPYIKDVDYITSSLEDSVKRAGAEILHSHFHIFGPENGLTGILVLKESHASVHTWPESDLMTFDIFMCGLCNPLISFEYLKERLKPKIIRMMFTRRGNMENVTHPLHQNSNFLSSSE